MPPITFGGNFLTSWPSASEPRPTGGSTAWPKKKPNLSLFTARCYSYNWLLYMNIKMTLVLMIPLDAPTIC